MKSAEILVVGDMHLPFVHKPSFDLLLRVIEETKPDVVVQIGDLLDGRALSRHVRQLSERGLAAETASAKSLFRELDAACVIAGVKRKVITLGNHDSYMTRYVGTIAPELEDYGGLQDPIDVVGVRKCGWETCSHGNYIKLGKIGFTHDVGMHSTNSVTQAAQKFGGSVVFGHTHGASVFYTGSLDGDRRVAMNVGWLGDPEYTHYMPSHHKANLWVHGLGHIRIFEDGLFWANFAPIINNSVCIEGKRISL